MDAKLVKNLPIDFSRCDSGGKLGIPQAFALCMDLAGEHAEALGNGVGAMMERGLFWVAVKTVLRFFRRPALLETVTAETWPEAPGRMRGDRDYVLRAGEELLLCGKTEWTILNTRDGGLWSPRNGIYAPGMEFSTDRCCPEPYHRFTDAAPWEPFAEYTVCSTDIDMGGHMNNAAYARMLAGLFSTAQRRALAPREVEIHYRAACYEGDRLSVERRQLGNTLELRVISGGAVAALARISFREEQL
ncbi:MAG: hypothetical protein IJ617_09285 [Oscillospiraceae bacterium]|nr:hypothetical protein [Oscillospiraceae bacterium]